MGAEESYRASDGALERQFDSAWIRGTTLGPELDSRLAGGLLLCSNRGMTRGAWIVGAIALFVVATCGLLLWVDHLPAASNRPSVPLLVEPSLSPGDAWTLPRAASPRVLTVWMDGGNSVQLLVSDPVVGEDVSLNVELTVRFEIGAESAEVRVDWTRERTPSLPRSFESGKVVQGVVKIDADRIPAAGDPRTVSYELLVSRGDRPIELRGKIRLP